MSSCHDAEYGSHVAPCHPNAMLRRALLMWHSALRMALPPPWNVVPGWVYMPCHVLGRSPCQPCEDKSSLHGVIPTQDMEPIPGWAAIVIPSLYQELRPAFSQCYDNDKWVKGKFNIQNFCNDDFFKQHWKD
ncbi:hypothetical protein R1flu_005024 [Riccia fluitans]|uniref:Uncharacterized protein n=1 Tax=Riccia fluitans TaxID=41844 RepID=A0ABD1YRZ5_9MARC